MEDEKPDEKPSFVLTMEDEKPDEKPSFARILDTIEEHSMACAIGICHEHTFYFVHVHKGKGLSEMKIEDPSYVVHLDRSKGVRLGLKLDVQAAKRSLFIKEVLGGLAQQYNVGAPTKNKVRPGDRIVRVNTIEADCNKMLEECKKRGTLELEIHRGSAIPITAGLAATVKVPFGNFLMGQEGVIMKIDEEGDALLKMTHLGRTQWIVKQDYDKFLFEDHDRYYLKRYCDFRDMHTALKTKFINQEPCAITTLPEFPSEETFGFRRQLASLGMSNFMNERREDLQKVLDQLFSQVDMLEDEPVLAQFFAGNTIPSDVGATKEDILKQRLEALVINHQDKVLLAQLSKDTQDVLRERLQDLSTNPQELNAASKALNQR